MDSLKTYKVKVQASVESTLSLTQRRVPVETQTSSSDGVVPILEDATRGTFFSKVPAYNTVDNEKFPEYITWIKENKFSKAVLKVLRQNALDNSQRESKSSQEGSQEEEEKTDAGEDVLAQFKSGCSCVGVCRPATCQCLSIMGGKFPYTATGLIALVPGLPIYECNDYCGCSEKCQNRVIQKGSKAKLEIFKTAKKGWGVRAAEDIKRGTFICEYLGEIIGEADAEERGKEYDRIKLSYLYDLDYASEETKYTIDAFYYGNVARFINHSCAPNLTNMQFWIEHHDISLPRVGFFANRQIRKSEELTFDYHYPITEIKANTKLSEEDEKRAIVCECGKPGLHVMLYDMS